MIEFCGPEDHSFPTRSGALLPSESLERLLEGIAGLMKRSFSVDEATVQMLTQNEVVTVAVWARRSTALWAGARIHLAEASLLPMRCRNRCVFSGEAPCDGFIPILDRILRSEGTRCWVCCPLRDDGHLAGTLTLGSAVPGALAPAEEPYFRTVTALFEPELVELGRQAERELAPIGRAASGW
jgi:hypothetical protein